MKEKALNGEESLNKEQPLNFEQALTRLETVVEAMENDETTLEASISLYKEGITLSNYCNEILSRFESEITALQKEADGSFTEKPIKLVKEETKNYV